MTKSKALTNTLQLLEEIAGNSEIYFGDIVKALDRKGFGALLMAPTLLAILPTGAIPGIPAICALFIFLTAAQIIAGRSYPWLPKKLKEFSFKREQLISVVHKTKPYAAFIDRFIKPRIGWLSTRPVQIIVALICCFLSLIMALIGFVPFLPALIGIPILFFAAGISAKDGLMVLCGLGLTIIVVVAIIYFSGITDKKDKISEMYPAMIPLISQSE